ncbi:hypothetical protein [Pseudomonas sp. NPDC096925]|uniref:hypothetical protein n=1 Tax=Pseudomonas sp. NPDC096925 TaxID=3364484 RepID=UPI00383AC111
MSYTIDMCFMEGQSVAKVTIHGISELYKSVRTSQFQCIGWILEITRLVKSKVDGGSVVNPEYAVQALINIGGLSEIQAEELMLIQDVEGQFRYVWSCLDETERECAIHMNFDHYDNFWPGFDYYSCAWSESLCHIEAQSQTKNRAQVVP